MVLGGAGQGTAHHVVLLGQVVVGQVRVIIVVVVVRSQRVVRVIRVDIAVPDVSLAELGQGQILPDGRGQCELHLVRQRLGQLPGCRGGSVIVAGHDQYTGGAILEGHRNFQHPKLTRRTSGMVH